MEKQIETHLKSKIQPTRVTASRPKQTQGLSDTTYLRAPILKMQLPSELTFLIIISLLQVLLVGDQSAGDLTHAQGYTNPVLELLP